MIIAINVVCKFITSHNRMVWNYYETAYTFISNIQQVVDKYKIYILLMNVKCLLLLHITQNTQHKETQYNIIIYHAQQKRTVFPFFYSS